MFDPIPGVFVLGLGHRARHGKDTVAKAITDAYPDARRYSFADDLYAYCRVVYGMQGKDAPLLQRVGVEWRHADTDVWVRAVYSKLLMDRPRVAVITDVRFPNEVEFVASLGGVCWKVERRVVDGSLYVDPSRPADHISETALNGYQWDRIIVGRDGQLEMLTDAALAAFAALPHGLPEPEPLAIGPQQYVCRAKRTR